MSGRSPARCCTWTPSAFSVLTGRDTGRPATDQAATAAPAIVYAHCVVDDHSRLAYVELHGADTGQAAAAPCAAPRPGCAEQGAGPVEAVMTDNAFAYRHSRAFQPGPRRARRPPHPHAAAHPRWNGKVERFIQTLDDEWAHGHVWPDSTRRDRGLASWLRFYNRRRPHTSLGDRPPISRVHQDRGQDIAGGGALAPPAPLAPAARRLLMHPRLMPYPRLVVAVLALNAAVLGLHVSEWRIDDRSALSALAALALVR